MTRPRSLLFAFGVTLVLGLSARDAEAKDVSASDVATDGLQTSLMRVRGSDKDADLGAIGLSTSRLGFGIEKGIAVRVVNTGSLAVGSKGLQGGLDSAAAGGYRFTLGPRHGIVVRGGFEGAIFGNKYLWDSMLEVPQAQLGYQWLGDVKGSGVADIAAKTGYVLFGRHNTGDAVNRRMDGSPEAGGIAALHLGPIDLRASYTRVFARHGDPVDEVEAAFCAQTSAITLCERVRYEVADTTRVSFLGLSIGLTKKKSRHD